MRSAWRLAALLLLLVLGGSCDTTQPLQLTDQLFEVHVTGNGASVNSYAVWDMYEDLNANDVHDEGEPLYLYCEDTGVVNISPISAPFPFTIQISVLRAGQTDVEVLTSAASLQQASNLAQYDGGPPQHPAIRTLNPISIFDPATNTTRRFAFINANRRLVTPVTREVVSATENPLHDIDPGTYSLGQGWCSSFDPGPAIIDQQPQPYPITLNKGDTVVVELRRGTAPPPGIPFNLNGEPAIRADLLLDGDTVAVRGEQVTTKDPGSGIKFSFTSL